MKQECVDPYLLDKNLVRRDFNDAARGYEETAVLQRIVSERLVERLDLMAVQPKKILDLGSGTGLSSHQLSKRFRRARIYQVDLAINMLKSSRRKSRRIFSRQSQICADAERLPLADNCLDMVFSSLMLQWCPAPDQVFKEAGRALRSGGLLIFSSFGPDTLHELRDSWKAADDTVHVNAFIDMHDLGDALIRNGFEHPVMEMEYFVMNYGDVFSLMRDLKHIGAHNINPGRRRTLTGKNRLERMKIEYEKSRHEGKLPATYEVVFGHAWKRGMDATPAGERWQTMISPVSLKRRRT